MQHTVTKILTKIGVIPVVASMMMFSTIPGNGRNIPLM